MTVHGAKGLEAPIVILADATSTEEGRATRSVFMQAQPPLFIHAPNKRSHVEESREHKREADEAQQREYWRKLYVAMTRAEDELYVTGPLTKTGKIDKTWYQAIETALRPGAESISDAEGNETALVYPAERAAVAPASAGAGGAAPGAALVLPALPEYRLRRIVRPSSAFALDADPDMALATNAERVGDPRDPEAARREGIALHALLQHLARLPADSWDAVAGKALPLLLPEAPQAHGVLLSKARSILTRLELMHLFGPQSRAEVPILAHGTRNGAPVTIAGRIDRLVIEADRVLVVDYKSDAKPPATEKDAPAAYVSQIGLYALIAGQLFPGRRVEAAILWTSLEMLMNLPPSRLAQAVSSFTIG
jgi:ATP-dependent helicase/nuclease subunit A